MADPTPEPGAAAVAGTRTIGADRLAEQAPDQTGEVQDGQAWQDGQGRPVTLPGAEPDAGLTGAASGLAASGAQVVARASGIGTGLARAQGAGRLRALPTLAPAAPTGQRGVASGLVPSPPDEVDERPPERPRGLRRRGALGRGHVLQVVWCQLAVLVVLTTWPLAGPARVAGAVAAATLVATVTARFRGRWVWQWVGPATEFVRRTRTRRTGSVTEPVHAVSVLRPGALIGTMLLDDVPVGLIEHPDGVTVVLADGRGREPVLPDEDPVPALSPLEVLDATPAQGPPATAQLVAVTSRPDPDAAGPLSDAYVDGFPGAATARSSWVALQLLRTVDLHGDGGLAEVMGHTLGAVQRRMRRTGHPVRALGPAELTDMLTTTTGLTTAGPVRERWTRWETPTGSQATLKVTRWPQQDTADEPGLLELLVASAPVSTVVSLSVRGAGTSATTGSTAAGASGPAAGPPVVLEGLVRLVAPHPEALEAAVDVLVEVAAERGATLDRRDGQHRAGAAATCGLGGFA